ncbi:hypothetical protein MWU76_16855 [Gelidibacter sp. F2691]|nr:hypothetical protein [Gelidibacter sp. F2691]
MKSKYLTAKEAATYTKLSESYLAKLRMGTSPIEGPKYLLIGLRSIRYRTSDLDDWMNARALETASKQGRYEMARVDKNGSSLNPHGTYVRREVMETPAWRAMSANSQMLYIWLKLEWKGSKNNNNGKIRLSCRQAALRLGVSTNTAMKAFHDLQAKGFIVISEMGALGSVGHARGPNLELTEIEMPNVPPRLLFRSWKPDREFEVVRHRVNNPNGPRGNKNP